jgi:hypothetical protein
MLEEDILKYSLELANFISTKDFEPITQRTPYYHMGATIVDSVLQAGLSYRHVVYPRVQKLLNEFSDYTTTCDFIILMQAVPLTDLINWKNARKLELINNLSWFFYENQIENEDMLASWLNYNENINQLAKIKGVGPKTVDYLKMLSGNQAIAVDRHLFKFLEMAGVVIQTYHEANLIYCKAAEILKLSKYELDRKIWLHMSKTRA